MAILTTVVIIAWIVFSIYHNYTTSTINRDTSISINPISAEFDSKTIDKIKSKQGVTTDLSEIKATASATTAEPIIAEATSSASQTASASGQTEL